MSLREICLLLLNISLKIMGDLKLSVLIPAYNEKNSIETVVNKVLEQNVPGIWEIEIILVDDCSTDGTIDIVKSLVQKNPDRVHAFYHSKNFGKGAAVRTAVENMSGDACIIQDADLEYNPEEYGLILAPIVDGRADCVYGSRFVGSQPKRVLFFWHLVGNKLLTLLSNMLTNLSLTDIETGYKAFRADVIKSIPLRSNDFRFEPEITAKIGKRKFRIYEVGISYTGRTYKEGKKVNWLDGVKAILAIFYFWIVNDSIKNFDNP